MNRYTLAAAAAALLSLSACATGPDTAPTNEAPPATPLTMPGSGVPDSANEGKLFTNARRLTLSGLRAGEGYYSADGTKIAFQSEREADNPFYQIYALDLTTGDSWRVSPGHGKTTCAWFVPGTDEVLFASTHHDPKSRQYQQEELDFRASGKERRYSWDYDAEFELYVGKVDGTGTPRNISNARGYDAEACVSPDGKLVVFSSNREAYARPLSEEESRMLAVNPAFFADLYVMNIDGTGLRRVTTAEGYDGGPFFSPDGARIVWRHFDREGLIADVWTMNVDGTDRRQVTDFQCMSWAPYYHPSMQYIAFASNKHGFTNFEVFIVDVEGRKQPVRVTWTEGFDGLPVFSPDGGTLLWTSGREGSGKGQLWRARWNHEAALRALAEAPNR